jgi:hypothetical protein
MSDSGIIAIQSHSYDMHQYPQYEAGDARENILIMDGEKETDYINALKADHQRICDDISGAVGQDVYALAFPFGKYDTLSQAVLISMGIRVTMSVDHGHNTVIKGLPQSLLSMKRFTVTNDIDIIFCLN